MLAAHLEQGIADVGIRLLEVLAVLRAHLVDRDLLGRTVRDYERLEPPRGLGGPALGLLLVAGMLRALHLGYRYAGGHEVDAVELPLRDDDFARLVGERPVSAEFLDRAEGSAEVLAPHGRILLRLALLHRDLDEHVARVRDDHALGHLLVLHELVERLAGVEPQLLGDVALGLAEAREGDGGRLVRPGRGLRLREGVGRKGPVLRVDEHLAGADVVDRAVLVLRVVEHLAVDVVHLLEDLLLLLGVRQRRRVFDHGRGELRHRLAGLLGLRELPLESREGLLALDDILQLGVDAAEEGIRALGVLALGELGDVRLEVLGGLLHERPGLRRILLHPAERPREPVVAIARDVQGALAEVEVLVLLLLRDGGALDHLLRLLGEGAELLDSADELAHARLRALVGVRERRIILDLLDLLEPVLLVENRETHPGLHLGKRLPVPVDGIVVHLHELDGLLPVAEIAVAGARLRDRGQVER